MPSQKRTKAGIETTRTQPVFRESRNIVSKLVGYARVSRTSQSLDAQTDALRAAGAAVVFADHGVSGAARDRAGLDAALAEIGAGDVLVVIALDRLGRDLGDLVRIVAALSERGGHLRAMRESIDTTTAVGRMLFGVFGSLAEYERELIRERTADRLAAKKRRGERVGRKRLLTPSQVDVARRELAHGNSAAKVARNLRVGRSTLYRALGEFRATGAEDVA
jgi:DNA invertase Pin-like site-specific DNA recombinase